MSAGHEAGYAHTTDVSPLVACTHCLLQVDPVAGCRHCLHVKDEKLRRLNQPSAAATAAASPPTPGQQHPPAAAPPAAARRKQLQPQQQLQHQQQRQVQQRGYHINNRTTTTTTPQQQLHYSSIHNQQPQEQDYNSNNHNKNNNNVCVWGGGGRCSPGDRYRRGGEPTPRLVKPKGTCSPARHQRGKTAQRLQDLEIYPRNCPCPCMYLVVSWFPASTPSKTQPFTVSPGRWWHLLLTRRGENRPSTRPSESSATTRKQSGRSAKKQLVNLILSPPAPVSVSFDA